MVKRREPRALSSVAKQQPSPEQVEAFAAAADGGSRHQPEQFLDPNAKRDYKAIRVPFNEYEFSKLEELAQRTGRTKLNAIRWAILKLSEEEEKGTKTEP